MAKRVSIRLYADGRIEAKTIGIPGKACMKMISGIENLLDARTAESAFTQEYYEQNLSVETEQTQILEQKGQL